jgi:ATP-dependent Clp protease ATP-binding subunit ClpA
VSRRRPQRGPISSRPIAPILAAARDEASAARHGYLGLEHLLLALTRPNAGEIATLLASFGAGPTQVRDAVRLVIGSGHGDGPRFDAATLLATIGIDLDEVRRQVERRFGPTALHDLYSSPVGWNLRPRGPLCDLPISPNLQRAVSDALGHCWDNAPPQLHARLLLAALDTHSPGLTAVLEELTVDAAWLRRAAAEQVKIAS